jgi:hypothetical protein
MLANDDELSDLFDHQLRSFALSEPNLLTVLDQCSVEKKAIAKFYFNNKYLRWLNNHPAGLELGQVAHFFNLSAPLVEHAIIHFLISEKLHNYLGMCCGHSHHSHGHKKHKHHHKAPTAGAVFAYNAYNIIHTAIHVAGAKALFDDMAHQADLIKEMQARIMSVRKCIESARQIWNIAQEYSDFAQHVTHYKELEELFVENNSLSADLKEFLELLNTKTFVGDASVFSRAGRILRAYYLAGKVHNELLEKLSAIAEIDFLVSTAKLVREHADSDTPMSFTHYCQQDKPSIELKMFWNPLFTNVRAMENVLSIGGVSPHVAIVTGPNKGGKSTVLFSVALAVVLGQTLTLSPAKYCKITPFQQIHTGFCIHQRIIQGESLFSASLKFANECLSSAREHTDQFVLILADELFNSTQAQQGSVLSAHFASALGDCSNSIAMIATHFSELTELEEKNPVMFRNYCVGFDKANITRNYFFQPGIAKQENVLELIDDQDLVLR